MSHQTSKIRLAILSIIAGCVYLFIITSNFVSNWSDMAYAFNEGWENQSLYETTGKAKSWQTHELYLVPKSYQTQFSDSLYNNHSHSNTPIRVEVAKALHVYDQPETSYQRLLSSTITIISIAVLVVYIAVFIIFFRLILSLYKDRIFAYANVRNLRLLGLLNISKYVLTLLFYGGYLRLANSLFDFEQYTLKLPDLHHEVLLTGIVLLIAANVTQRALTLKEEQDLTI